MQATDTKRQSCQRVAMVEILLYRGQFNYWSSSVLGTPEVYKAVFKGCAVPQVLGRVGTLGYTLLWPCNSSSFWVISRQGDGKKTRDLRPREPVLRTLVRDLLSITVAGMQEAEGVWFLTWAFSPWASCTGRRVWLVPCDWQLSSTGLSSSWTSSERWVFGRPAPGGSFWTWI